MANDQRAKTGCRPIVQPYGAMRVQALKITTGAAIYLYTPLTLDNGGQVAVATSAANVVMCGVAIGFLDANKSGLPGGLTSLSAASYFPATGYNGYALVTTDPNQLYLMEEGTGGTALTQSAIGNTVTFEEVSLGSTTTGISDIVIQQSSLETSTQGTFRLMAYAEDMNSDGSVNAAGNGAKWIVRINKHQFGDGLGSGVPI